MLIVILHPVIITSVSIQHYHFTVLASTNFTPIRNFPATIVQELLSTVW
jgi:hypothetical protein